MITELPYWWPTLTDQSEHADGKKYETLWDHVGDAYDDYEKLADAFLLLVRKYNLSPGDFK